MMILALLVAVNCAQPRLTFREFYSAETGIPQGSHCPAQQYELSSTVNARLADEMANYADYVVQYRDQCTVQR